MYFPTNYWIWTHARLAVQQDPGCKEAGETVCWFAVTPWVGAKYFGQRRGGGLYTGKTR